MDGLSKTFGKLTISLLVVLAISFSALPALGQYCSASGGGEQYISAVVVGNLVNLNTGSDGYADYTGMSTDIAVGESQAATIMNGLSIAGSQCGIWVDWNADSDFDDAGETIAMSGGPEAFTGTITAPGETTAGDKRMRVRIMGSGSLTPCGNTTCGEVEDYTIAVVAPWTGSGDANDPYQIWTAAVMPATARVNADHICKEEARHEKNDSDYCSGGPGIRFSASTSRSNGFNCRLGRAGCRW